MRAQTIHRSQSRASVGSSDSDSNSLNRTQIPSNAVPKEIDMYGKYLSGTIDEEQIESLSEGETDDRYSYPYFVCTVAIIYIHRQYCILYIR